MNHHDLVRLRLAHQNPSMRWVSLRKHADALPLVQLLVRLGFDFNYAEFLLVGEEVTYSHKKPSAHVTISLKEGWWEVRRRRDWVPDSTADAVETEAALTALVQGTVIEPLLRHYKLALLLES